jgi:hypothetical protein
LRVAVTPANQKIRHGAFAVESHKNRVSEHDRRAASRLSNN